MTIEDVKRLRDGIPLPDDEDTRQLKDSLIARVAAEVYKLQQGEIEKLEPICEGGYVAWYVDNTIICAPDVKITDLFSPLDDDIILGRRSL